MNENTIQNRQTPKSSSLELLQKCLIGFALIGSMFIILTYIISMGLGILVVFSTTEGLQFIQSSNNGVYFIFIWCIFALCFAAAWRFRESLSNQIKKFLSKTGQGNIIRNNLLIMPLITSMLFIAILVLHLLQSQFGYPTGSPSVGDPFNDFLAYSQAPIVEELIFRIFPIGAFLVTFIFIVSKSTRPHFSTLQRIKICILAILQPEKAKEKVGLKTVGQNGLLGGGVSISEWIMVIFTASLFGIAHYFGGWEVGKISQAAMSGIVFAIAYLYYGIQAPLLLHWYFNYYFTVFDLSSEFYVAEIDALYSLAFLANVFLGVILWLAVILFGALAIFKRIKMKSQLYNVPE
jgi:hypothetical protein